LRSGPILPLPHQAAAVAVIAAAHGEFSRRHEGHGDSFVVDDFSWASLQSRRCTGTEPEGNQNKAANTNISIHGHWF